MRTQSLDKAITAKGHLDQPADYWGMTKPRQDYLNLSQIPEPSNLARPKMLTD